MRRDLSEKWWFGALACLLLVLPPRLLAANDDIGLRLFDADAGEIGFAPRLRTDISVQVTGMIARVKVQQRFTNPHPDWVEGVYVFPLPENAAVDRLRLVYAERLIEGEIQERHEARRQYEQARTEGRAATLLDQQRANIFTTSVANIPPGETVQVEIVYQQEITWRQDRFGLRLPTVVGPRYIPGTPLHTESAGFDGEGWALDTDEVPDASAITPPVVANDDGGINPLGIEVMLNSGVALAEVLSPSHGVDVGNPEPGLYQVVLREERAQADRDFVLHWRPAAAQRPDAALFTEHWQGRHYSLLMLMPPHADAAPVQRRRELILVVDTSGSMHGESIGQARSALLDALDRLGPDDRFNVIQFNSEVSSLFEGAESADSENLSAARRYVNGLQAEGGTEMLPAMRLALAAPAQGEWLRQVVFLTDGSVGNEQALFREIVDTLGDSRLFTVGIGSAPNALFMTRAAEHGRGSFTYIGSTAEVAEKVEALFGQLSRPVLTDVSLQWLSGDKVLSVDQAPAAVPDLYAGQPLAVSVESGQAPDSVLISGRLGQREWQHRIALTGGGEGRGVHALWARREIRDWMARKTAGEDVEQVRDAVLELALEHHLVSAYTSLVAVDKTPIRDPDAGLHSGAVPSLLPRGWTDRALPGRLPNTATPASLLACLGVLSLVVSWWSARRRA